MATADSAVLDDFLSTFQTRVDAGFGLIQGDVSGTLATLVTISIVITALLWAIDENQNVLASLVRKVLLVGFFAWLVAQWHTLSTTVINGFAALGLKAGGGGMSVADFTTSPSKVVSTGIDLVGSLLLFVKRVAPGPIEFFAHIDVVAAAIIAAIGILIAFVILAVEIVVTMIEFHIVTLVAFVTVPFGVLTQTSFMSERAIGYVVSVGVKLMALAIVVSLGSTIFNSYTVSPAPGIEESVGLLLGAVVMVMLALKVPAIAGALISGGPQLNAGSAAVGAAGVAAGVAGAALAARAVGGAIAGGWAAGGAQVAAARSAAGGIPPSRSAGGPPSGGGGGRGPGPADFARAPVSSTVAALRIAGSRMMGGGGSSGSAPEAPPPPPAPSETIAKSQSRQGGLSSAARGAAAAAAQSDSSGPGMTATPRRPDEPEA